MSNSRKPLAVPDGWADVLVRAATVLVVAWVTLNLKEWIETRELDILACTIDAGCVGAATFVWYAILQVTSGWARRTEAGRPVHVGH